MKKIYLALMCVVSFVVMSACGDGNKKSSAIADDKAGAMEEAKVSDEASNLSVGERYAFAGLTSADIVPGFGKEITDFSDSEGNGIYKASTFFGYGSDREPFSDKVYNDYCKKLFDKMKSLSEDGKIYRVNTMDFKLKGEVADMGEMKKWDKSSPGFSFAYPYNGTWVLVDVSYRKSFSGKTEGTYGLDVKSQTFYKQ